ncbi:MAG: glycosyltransferase family 39 protein [Armatimonadota bacterium]|nr:glycosyltransferase family 39 protein [Armatimonadota bacterium]MDR7532824.1 glycosyltransferase family 39 protein [Armatimonadota bacterium]MDR7535172.1 glycosyltransferase family 39 protein [Armatimonadota bacterium]
MSDPGPPWSRWERRWTLLLLGAVALSLAGLGLPSLQGDDVFYGAIARHIVASGEWITLTHPDHPGWLVDKPPLTFWLMAISLRLGGDHPGVLRFWHVGLALATVAATWRLGRRALGREGGVLAALLLGTSGQFFYVAFDPAQDIPLTFFLTVAMLAYTDYRAGAGVRAAVLTGLAVALAVLTKGIVALVVFGLVVAGDLGLPPCGGAWRWRDVCAGAAVFLAVASPWFVAGALRGGRPFVDTFFLWGPLGVGRFFQGVTARMPYGQALVIFVPTLMVGVLPWTGLLPGAVREGWRAVRGGAPILRVCALWAGLYFLLLSLSPGDKMMHHLLPLYPAAMVLAARFVLAADGDPLRLRASAGVALAAIVPAVAGLVIMRLRYPETAGAVLPAAAPFVLGLLAALGAFAARALRGRAREAVALAGAAILVAHGFAEALVLRRWDAFAPAGRPTAPPVLRQGGAPSGDLVGRGVVGARGGLP